MSTGTNYPGSLDLWVNKNSGDDVTASEVNQWRSAIEQIERKHFPTLKDISEVSCQNTTTETQLHSLTIPGNSMGSTGILHGSAIIQVVEMTNLATLSLKYYYGGTLLVTLPIENTTGLLITFPIFIDFRIHNRNSTSSQYLSFKSELPGDTGGLLKFSTGSGGFQSITFVETTRDSTVNQDFALKVQWALLHVDNTCQGRVMEIKGAQ